MGWVGKAFKGIISFFIISEKKGKCSNPAEVPKVIQIFIDAYNSEELETSAGKP